MVSGAKNSTPGKAASSAAVKGRERYDPITPKKERKSFGTPQVETTESEEVVEKYSGYSIYIFNLPPDAIEIDLWRLFAPFGSIKNVAVMKEAEGNVNKGYGFVTMNHVDEASMAIEVLNGQSLRGRPLKISFKGKKPEKDSLGETGSYPLYVYNISQQSEEVALWKLFSQFGAVKNVAIAKDPNTDEPKGYAFVTMRNMDDATNAIKTLNGFILDGRQLNVNFKNKKTESNQTADETSDNKIGEHHIYVNNLKPETEESVLWKLFAQFGAIKDVNLVKDPKTKKCLGYAFVTMKSFEDATLAINTLNNSNLEDKVLHVSFKTKKTESKN